MTDDPISLDEHRGMADRKATEMRRRDHDSFEADQAALQRQEQDLEALLLNGPAETWPEAAAKAHFLITLFAQTPEGQEPRHAELIAKALDDLEQLCEDAKENP